MRAPSDEREIATWIRAYTPRLLRVATAFSGEDAEAEDILQEVWVIAATQAHRRPSGAPLGAWLHAVTLNRGRAHLRRRRRREWLRLVYQAELHPVPASDRLLAHDVVDDAPLWRAIAALPRLQREVVLLRVVDELSTRDTAIRLGRAEGTVKASLHRALNTLRHALASTSPTVGSRGTTSSPDSHSALLPANHDD